MYGKSSDLIYNFECQSCGDCCSGNMEIFINIYDIYKMSKYLKFKSSEELFKRGYILLTKGQNGIMLPKIKFKEYPYSFCPFLINDLDENNNLKGLCSLHPYIKPLVCILSPVSRIYSSKNSISEYVFTPPTENCPGINSCKSNNLRNLIPMVDKELNYESRFYDILEYISDNKIEEYKDSLYFFNTEDSFETILDSITSIFLAKE